ncbi:trypsin-like cysteine/serine peptidase domain-containing protein [Haematococcus lacustris]
MQSTLMRPSSMRVRASSQPRRSLGHDVPAAARALHRLMLSAKRAQRSNTVAAASPDPWGFYSNSPSSRPGPSSYAASSQASDSWARSQPSPAPRPSSAPPSSSATAATSTTAGPAAYNASEPWRPSASAFGSPPTSPSTEALIAELTAEEQRTVRLFQDNARSVVNVSTTRSFSPMFSPFMMQQQMPRGVGSGFVWDYDGHIITNAHVIAGAQEVTVTLCDGTVAKAKVVGGDREKDIAVLKVVELSQEQLASLRPVKLGSSSNLLVGQRVYAVGNPFGLDLALSQGIVSGLGREISAGGMWGGLGAATITNGIQTDTAMNPGNSGGPLLDSAGRVVGIATAILDPTGRGVSSGVGFAIPIDAVRGMVDQILRLGRVVRPALGITIAPVPQMMTRQPRWGMQAEQAPKAEGVLVVSVQPGGPADLAGVQPTRRELSGRLLLGDIITGINGRTVRTQKDLFAALDNSQVGDTAEVVVRSASGSTRTVRLTLSDREKMTGSE